MTDIEAEKSASKWNGLMAAAQIGLASYNGNVGFVGEAFHNASDAVSYGFKASSIESQAQSKQRALKLRRIAATVLAIGGIAGVGGGAYSAATGKNEDAGNLALAAAVAGATINSRIARKVHGAERSNTDNQEITAHDDGIFHSLMDMGTGWIYVGGLALERKIPGAANVAVMTNGVIMSGGAGLMLKRTFSGGDPHTHCH